MNVKLLEEVLNEVHTYIRQTLFELEFKYIAYQMFSISNKAQY